MQTFAYFLLKMTCCSTILFGYYWFFLRNKRFHAYNRFYLLAAVGLSITLPLLKFNFWQQSNDANAGLIKMLQVVNGDQYLEEVVIYSKTSALSTNQIIYSLYLLIGLLLAFFFVRAILKIYLLKNQSPSHWYQQILFINTEDKRAPFSFFKNIFWNQEIALESPTGQRILKHELVHVQEKHTHDKIFINVVLILFWCNPVFWLLRKELHLIHEFIADKKAIEDGDTAAFASMILASTYPKTAFNSINPFFYSPIKRRIQMLTRKNNPFASYFSRLLVLPVLFFVVIAFSFRSKSNNEPAFVAKKIRVVINAGHGGNDPGAVGNGLQEKNINLMLVKKIKELNTDPNVELIFTRLEDVYQSAREISDFTNNRKADLFIAVHLLSGPNKEVSNYGPLTVFVSKDKYENTNSSKLFGSALIGVFKENYKIKVADQPEQRQVGVWVIQEAKCPAVLIEAADIRSKKDMDYLVSNEGQTQFAKNVLKAISQFASAINNPDNYESTARQETTTTQFYKGKKIISANYEYKNNELSKIILNLADYTVSEITAKEAKELGLNFNAPPPPPPPPAAPRAPNAPMPPPPPPPTKEMAMVNNNNILKAEKITITNSSDTFKMEGNVKIKGLPTGKDQPLYVIDSKIASSNEMNSLEPNTIKSINVLKGEAAISKYGSQAKNGVIEVFTKDAVNPQKVQDDNKVFSKVEEEASFPGGSTAWRNYLTKNLNANVPVDDGWKAGYYTVVVKFIVHTDGSISDVIAETYTGSKAALEAINIIKNGPKWIPAKQNGIEVSAYRKQPITFVISEY